eukprot:g3652.t1
MLETMVDAEGVGLAAPQVGVDIQLAVIDVSHDPECVSYLKVNGKDAELADIMPLVFINPTLELGEEKETELEGCLSIENIRYEVRRPAEVKATLPQLDGSTLVIETDGLLGRALQHEIDHLKGILFTDRLSAVGKSSAGSPPASPFAIAPEAGEKKAPAASPFAVASESEPQAKKPASPFSVVNGDEEPKAPKLPERRKPNESPFQISEPQGFGYEATPEQAPQALKATAIEQERPSPAPVPASPFSSEQAASAAPQQPASPFGGWPQAEAGQAPSPVPVAQPAPPVEAAAPAPAPQPAPAPAPAVASAPESVSGSDSSSDSFAIKQLELRAIFGVDREMTKDEILQRARSLPGIRQIARVSASDVAAVDALKVVISNLGFGSSPIKLYSGSVPIEFIREGSTLLAVQTDGGFAPGVKETLMLVARELGK